MNQIFLEKVVSYLDSEDQTVREFAAQHCLITRSRRHGQ